MVSRWDLAWLLLLLLRAFGLNEGDPDASVVLQCYQSLVDNIMNCSWSTQEAPDVNTVFYYESLKFHPGQKHRVEVQRGCNWVIIGRRNLTQGDTYSVWVEAHSATSNKLTFNLDDIVKPPSPILNPVELFPLGAEVSWKLPDSSDDPPLTCVLRYKAFKDHNWIYLSEEHVGQDSYELENLEPFTSYEVQVRCIPGEGKGVWSEWSSPQSFITHEAAPQGQVDVWYKRIISENKQPSRLLLWKALDPEVARGIVLEYEVTFWGHQSKANTTVVCFCFNATVPHSADFASVSARNSVQKTLPANLSLMQTDLHGPEEVQVLVVQALGFNVTWKPSSSSSWVEPMEYLVEWQEELLSSKPELLNWTRRPGGDGYAFLKGYFKPKVPYTICVYAQYPQGSSPSQPVRVYFQEGVPSASPQALKDQNISPTAASFSWEKIPLAHRNGHIIYYTLYLKDPVFKMPKAFRIRGAAERSLILSDLKPGTSYQVWITGSTSAGEGVPSPMHYFNTPGSHWQIIVTVSFLVGFLIVITSVVIFVKHKWILGICHKILPLWCCEKVPDPGHSEIVQKIAEQNAAPGNDALSKHLIQCVEEMVLTELKEAPPQPKTPPVPVKNSGYEKRFLPTLEELQRLG